LVVVKIDISDEVNSDVTDDDDVEEEVEELPATADTAAPATATAAASASTMAPKGINKSWVATNPVVAEIGKDWTVVLTCNPMSMVWIDEPSVEVASVAGYPMLMKVSLLEELPELVGLLEIGVTLATEESPPPD
jgi:hypothetical protein